MRLDDVDAWRAAIRPNTKLLFLETPSNPLTTLADVRAIAASVLRHRIVLNFEAEATGVDPDKVVEQIVEEVG